MKEDNNSHAIMEHFKIFSEISREKKTGSLYVKSDDILRILYFSDGEVAFAHSNKKGERLVDIILESNILSKDYINDALEDIKPGKSVGKVLVEKGYLTPLQLSEIQEKQQKKIFFSLLLKGKGKFKFFEEDIPHNITPINLDVFLLIKKGLYSTENRKIVMFTIGNLNTSFDITKKQSKYIMDEEKNVLKLIEKNSIPEVINKSPYGEFRTLKIIAFLKLLNIITPKSETENKQTKKETDEQKEKDTFEPIVSEDKIEIDLSAGFFDEQPSESPEHYNISTPEDENKQSEPIENKNKKNEIKDKKNKIYNPFSNKSQSNEEEIKNHFKNDKSFLFKKIFLIGGFILLIIIIAGIFYLLKTSKNFNLFETENKKNTTELVKKKNVKIPEKKIIPEKKQEKDSITKSKPKVNNKKQTTKSEKEFVNMENLIPDYLDLIKDGKYYEASQKYREKIIKYSSYYSILVEIDCKIASVKTAFQKSNFDKNMFIVPRKVANRTCFAVLWGIYSNKEKAKKYIISLPIFFRKQTHSPKVILLEEYVQ